MTWFQNLKITSVAVLAVGALFFAAPEAAAEPTPKRSLLIVSKT